MDNLNNISHLVKEILKTVPETRNSDDVLYVKVCERCNPQAINKPFWYVLANLKDFSLPKFESVRRSRQKIQAAYPELAGCTAVEEQRIVNEEVFRSYARSINV